MLLCKKLHSVFFFGKITIAAFIIRTDYFVWDVIYIDKDTAFDVKLHL